MCSSYTRAVQSAAILSKELGLEIRIETDLHEWVANDLYIYEQKYADVPKVIVIGHGMMIEAVTGVPHPNFGEIVPFSLVGKE